MQTLRQLTPQDVLFVGGETPRIYQHTVGLMLIDGRDRPTPVISTATGRCGRPGSSRACPMGNSRWCTRCTTA